MYIGQCSVYIGQCSVYIGQCSVYIGQCSVYIGECSVYIGQCSVYIGRERLSEGALPPHTLTSPPLFGGGIKIGRDGQQQQYPPPSLQLSLPHMG